MHTTKRILKPVLNRIVPPLVKRYLKKERTYTYRGIKIKVPPGIFHPGLFFSTTVMLRFLETLEMKNKTFLEVGSGTGLVSIYAALKKNAVVTAVDINKKAVDTTIENAGLNHAAIDVHHSDMFAGIQPFPFDIVVTCPPFFPKDPQNDEERAWYCGKNHDFFYMLFKDFNKFSHRGTVLYMVLSDESPVREITEIAENNGLSAARAFERSNLWESNFILKLVLAA